MKLLPKKWFGKGEEHGLARHGNGGLARFRHEMDRAFDRMWREFDRGWKHTGPLAETMEWPALDMAEDDKAVTLRADVPGLGPENVNVEVSGNLLTIRGSRSDEWSENKGGLHRRERRSGSFVRTVTLPSYVDAEKIEARYDKGVMTVSIPKLPGHGAKRIPVKE
jgi:HSP20 family protein